MISASQGFHSLRSLVSASGESWASWNGSISARFIVLVVFVEIETGQTSRFLAAAILRCRDVHMIPRSTDQYFNLDTSGVLLIEAGIYHEDWVLKKRGDAETR